jgi:hypothetical protein
MTAFNPDVSPHPYHARLDKLRIVFPNHTVGYSSDDALRSFLRNLASPVGDGGGGPMLFSIDNYDLEIRSGWLFGGKIKIDASRGIGHRCSRVSMDLMLNPSRFYAHMAPDQLATWGTPEELLRLSDDRRAAAAAFTLNGEDNVLPHGMLPPTRPFLGHAMRYIGLVASLLRDRLHHGGDVEGCHFDLNWTGWKVYHAEVYWEYRSPDALALTHRLAKRLHAAVEEAETTTYSVPRPTPPRQPGQPRWRTLRNAAVTTTQLGSEGITLTAYAKEFDRLRLEVRYKKNLRQALGRKGVAGPRPETRPGQARRPDQATTTSLLALRSLLRVATEDAAERLGRVFAALTDMSAEVPSSFDGLASLFAHVFAAVSGDEARAKRLLSLLVHNFGISEVGLGDLAGAVRTLVGRGVLVETRVEQRRRAKRYRLAAAYRRTAAALRDGAPGL